MLDQVGHNLDLDIMMAHHLISKVERYYYSLRRAYEIVTEEHLELFDVDWLQMAIKVINNIIESNRLISTLLIFGAYLKIMKLDFPNSIIEYKATIIRKAMKEVRKI